MSAVEERHLLNLKVHVQDVTRLCDAVALDDLYQKIDVPVQVIVMVQVKDAINGMVDRVR